ncbi:MAG: hypothetical protein IPL39_06105 [Opitutaceae bacterium]|nr:hypothetical protein [Opitutaceae bacterium]
MVLAVALLAAVVLLLVALTALPRSELRATAQRGAAVQARQHALVGLRVAIGRLQAAAGPDACSTATAQHLGAGNPYWTGVWTDAGPPVWLVSGHPGAADSAVVTTGAAATGAELVGDNTTGVSGGVAAFFEDIMGDNLPGLAGEQTVGRFAYWTGDEGVKGNVGVVDRVGEVPVPTWPAADDPVTSDGERARLRQLVAHRSGNDAMNEAPPTGGFQLQAEDDPASAVRWAQFGAALTMNQLSFQTLGTSLERDRYRAFVHAHFHDFTVHSLGVLANAANGGLRRNFSDLAAPEVPAAVKDLERYRPVAGRLPLAGGTAGPGEPTAQIKPIVTEWALDFVPYREEGGDRLLVGCRLRLELWNPFNLPLAQTPAGVIDYRVRCCGRRSTGGVNDSGLALVRVSGPGGLVGEFDLRALLGPEREIGVDATGDLGPGQVVVVETIVDQGWATGLVVADPTPTDPSDDELEIESVVDAARELRLELWAAAGGAKPLTVLAGFPSGEFGRASSGGWAVPGNRPFAGSGAMARLGVSHHFRLQPARTGWGDWVDPAAPLAPAPDLRSSRIDYAAALWPSIGADPAASARAVDGLFASGELFVAGSGFAAYDFTVQRALSIAALDQLSMAGERPFGVGSPWGGARNAVFDAAFFNPVPGSWQSGERFANVRHRVLQAAGGPSPSAAELGGLHAARFLGVEGMYNVNSASPQAWTVLLGRTVLGWTDSAGVAADLENPFFGFAQSAPFAPEAARGVRRFSDAAIQRLATELAGRSAGRARPFRSVAEFVSSGVVQEAIDAAGLNTSPAYCDDLGRVPPARYSANYLTQRAVLGPLAPLLAVRSDTFTIRVYAEALNPALLAGDAERVAARAWCEAVVQRRPEFVDGSEGAEVWPPVVAVNRALGRRFRLVAFRWLGPEDL